MTAGDGERDGSGEVPQEEREDRPELDVDTAFAAIVARWGQSSGPGEGDWPEAENLAAGRPGESAAADPWVSGGEADTSSERPRNAPLIPGLADLGSEDGLPEPAEDGERFVPPDPPPLPRGDMVARLAWAGVGGGPVFLLLAALFWRDLPQVLLLAAVAAFVGGFVTLVLRMPREHPDDDDGAVV